MYGNYKTQKPYKKMLIFEQFQAPLTQHPSPDQATLLVCERRRSLHPTPELHAHPTLSDKGQSTTPQHLRSTKLPDCRNKHKRPCFLPLFSALSTNTEQDGTRMELRGCGTLAVAADVILDP